MDGLGEGWPRGRMLILRMAGEQLMAALGTDVDAWGGRQERGQCRGALLPGRLPAAIAKDRGGEGIGGDMSAG